MKLEALQQLAEIRDEYDVDKIEFFIEDLEDKIGSLIDGVDSYRSQIADLESDKIQLQEEFEQFESNCFEYPDGFSRSIVSDSIIEKFFDNLNRIPMNDLEDFVNKYAV